VPVATPLPTLTVRVWFTGLLPETVTLAGERVTPLGALTRERFTVPVKPFWGGNGEGSSATRPLLDCEVCGVEGDGEVGGRVVAAGAGARLEEQS